MMTDSNDNKCMGSSRQNRWHNRSQPAVSSANVASSDICQWCASVAVQVGCWDMPEPYKRCLPEARICTIYSGVLCLALRSALHDRASSQSFIARNVVGEWLDC